MLDIKPETLARYREIIAHIDVPMERKDEMIRMVVTMMQSFVDAAFGVDPTQLALAAKLSKSFQNASGNAMVSDGYDAERMDLLADHRREGANTPKQNEEKGCAP
ncbi:hypothetical protein [Sphingopyxis sp. Geo48]|uniref:hypothetical protein n=1 Tax=Sphingopyxis sp. Geo48 TaxID=545241 RepID=UPI0024B6DF86|nr:hypothetical protein [Sphingopyxis sp. Geo48]